MARIMVKAIAIAGIMTMAGSMVYQPRTVTEKNIAQQVSMVDYSPLAKKIRIVRESKQITREALAGALNISELDLENIEKGTKIPLKETIFKMEEILETTFVMEDSLCRSNP